MSKSLSDLTSHVADALHLLPQVAFEPENIVLGQYTFLPWARGGIGAAVTAPTEAGGIRATIAVAVSVQADGLADLVAQPPTPLHVRGPGDVAGIDERQVIRRYPVAGASNAEDSFLAHIEFDRPELPWLFTPAAPAGNRLPPWIALIVLAAGRYDLAPGRGGLPPQVTTHKSELQPLEGQSFAWAHAQLVGPVTPGPTVADRLTSNYASVNLSRLVCPRRLEADTEYLACVVPTYDAGVQTGLGVAAPGTLNPAWTRLADGSDNDDAVTLPVYSSWQFGTGPAGDFESLAEKLRGQPAPWQVGRRVTDVGVPGGELPPLPPGAPGSLQTIHGPLVSPQAPRTDSANTVEVAAAGAEAAGWPQTETEALRTLLNTPDRIANRPPAVAGPPPDIPVVGPEIYARYHAAVSTVTPDRDGDWLGQLNLRPEFRVMAGLGTRVVQKDQEELMQAAWAQVGPIDDANRQLRWAQLARFVGTATHATHVAPLAYGDLLAATRGVHSRVLAQPALTVAAAVSDSNIADAAVTSAFRRVTRPLGGLATFAAGQRAQLGRLVADGPMARDMQRPYVELDGIAGISELAATALDPQVVAGVLGVAPEGVKAALLAHGEALAARPSVTDALTEEAVAHGTAAPGFSLMAQVSRQLFERLAVNLPDPGKEPARALALLPVLVALVSSGGDIGAKVAQLLTELRHALGFDRLVLSHPVITADPGVAQLLGALKEAAPAQVSTMFLPVAADLVATDWPATPVRPALAVAPPALLNLIRPAVTVTARIRGRLGTLPAWLPPDWFDDQLVRPIMAAPVFTRPMYQALDDYSREWLLPGLATFSQPDLVTVLQSNGQFLEGFLAGLSHEMGRELLWRGYPTDQRGTYFRRFWDGATDDLAQDLHRFTPTALGTHLRAHVSGRVVLLVRGELIRRYPDALVLAMRAGAADAAGRPIFEDPVTDPGSVASILFHGHLAPDITLVGFDLTVADIAAAPADKGWWFLIAEHPTAPRFGLRETRGFGVQLTRDSLAWGDLTMQQQGPPPVLAGGFLDPRTTTNVADSVGGPNVPFGADAATIAHVLLRDPVRAAFGARALLGPTGAVNQ